MAIRQSNTLPLLVKDIEEWPGYRVDSHGMVWSCLRLGPPYGMTDTWRPLSASLDRGGYPFVWLYLWGVKKIVRVHRLVLEAFVGPCPVGMECRHLDNNRANAWLDNLAWGTKAENMADKLRHGTNNHGERCGQAKLKDADVIEIRRLRAEGLFQKEIARRFGVSRSLVGLIATRQCWKHI